MPSPTLLQCFRDAKKRDGGSVQGDATTQPRVTLGATQTWRVVYDGFVEWPTVITATLGTPESTLPRRGDVQNGLVCTQVNPVRASDHPFVWDVTVSFASIQQPSGTGNTNNWNINLKRGYVTREETVLQDRLKLPLINAFGDLLPQLPSKTFTDEVITVTWTTSKPPKWANDNYETWVNNDPVSFTICGITRSYAKGQMKCMGMPLSCTRTQTGSDLAKNPIYTIHYDCEMSFQIRKPKWVWYAPNEGWAGYDDHAAIAINKPGIFKDPKDKRTPATAPTKIDRDGIRLPASSTPIRLPDGMYGIKAGGPRQYDEDGAFELEDQRAFSDLFKGLNDGEQHP